MLIPYGDMVAYTPNLHHQTRQVDSMKVAKVASAAAEGMVSSLRITKPRIPWLFFEGVELAAKQVRHGEQWSCWGDPKFEQPQYGGIFLADF